MAVSPYHALHHDRASGGGHVLTPVATIRLSSSGPRRAVGTCALAAAGATLLLFTTGRGTPLGFPAPTLKISSNSALAQIKPRWIDFDAGTLLTGASMEERSRALLDLIVATASGRETCAERDGERELAIWKKGVTL